MADDWDSLFAAPPTRFIEERKRIVAALKGAGRKDEAKAVEKIPRPSIPVWTVNQIARRDPELVRRLGAITDRLKIAAGPEYGAAAAELRQALDDLRGEAAAVLAAAGHEDGGPHLIQRVIANVRAAAGGAETRAALEQGRLARDVEEQEITSLFGTAAAAVEAPAARAAKPAPSTARADAKATAKAAADAKAEERARAKQIAPPNARSNAFATPRPPRARKSSARSAPSQRPARGSIVPRRGWRPSARPRMTPRTRSRGPKPSSRGCRSDVQNGRRAAGSRLSVMPSVTNDAIQTA